MKSVFIAAVLLLFPGTVFADPDSQNSPELQLDALYQDVAVSMFSDDKNIRLGHAVLDSDFEKNLIHPLLDRARQEEDKETLDKIKVVLIGTAQQYLYRQFRSNPIPGYEDIDVLNEINASLLGVFRRFDTSRRVRFLSWAGQQGWQKPAKLRKKKQDALYEDIGRNAGEDGGSVNDWALAGTDTTKETLQQKEIDSTLARRQRLYRSRILLFLANPAEKVPARSRALVEVFLFHDPPMSMTELSEMTGYTRANFSLIFQRLTKRMLARYKMPKTRNAFHAYLTFLEQTKEKTRPENRTAEQSAKLALSKPLENFMELWKKPNHPAIVDVLTRTERVLSENQIPLDRKLRVPLELYLFHSPRLTLKEIGAVMKYSTKTAGVYVNRAVEVIQKGITSDRHREEFLHVIQELKRRNQAYLVRTVSDKFAIESSATITSLRKNALEKKIDLVSRGLQSLPKALSATSMTTLEATAFSAYYLGPNHSLRKIAKSINSNHDTVSKRIQSATNKVITWLVQKGVYRESDLPRIEKAWKDYRGQRRTKKRNREPAVVATKYSEPEVPISAADYLELSKFIEGNRQRILANSGLSPEMANVFKLRYLEASPLHATQIANKFQLHPKSLQRKIRTLDTPMLAKLINAGVIDLRQSKLFARALAEYREASKQQKKAGLNLTDWLREKSRPGRLGALAKMEPSQSGRKPSPRTKPKKTPRKNSPKQRRR